MSPGSPLSEAEVYQTWSAPRAVVMLCKPRGSGFRGKIANRRTLAASRTLAGGCTAATDAHRQNSQTGSSRADVRPREHESLERVCSCVCCTKERSSGCSVVAQMTFGPALSRTRMIDGEERSSRRSCLSHEATIVSANQVTIGARFLRSSQHIDRSSCLQSLGFPRYDTPWQQM